MSYHEALEAAGATVHSFEQFGSYQGDWYAKVTYQEQTGFITGSFGSCSYCDAFEGEFGWCDEQCEDHKYGEDRQDCEACQEKKLDYATRLKAFGEDYLSSIKTKEEAMEIASRNEEWDLEVQSILKYLKEA